MDVWEKIVQLRALATQDPNDALTWYLLGTALVQATAAPGEPRPLAEAIAALERAIALNPAQTAAHRWLGDAHRAAGHPAAARLAYERAIEVAERTGELQVAREARALLNKL